MTVKMKKGKHFMKKKDYVVHVVPGFIFHIIADDGREVCMRLKVSTDYHPHEEFFCFFKFLQMLRAWFCEVFPSTDIRQKEGYGLRLE